MALCGWNWSASKKTFLTSSGYNNMADAVNKNNTAMAVIIAICIVFLFFIVF